MVLVLCVLYTFPVLISGMLPLTYKEHYVPIDSLSKNVAIWLLGKDSYSISILIKYFHYPKETSRKGEACDQTGTSGMRVRHLVPF